MCFKICSNRRALLADDVVALVIQTLVGHISEDVWALGDVSPSVACRRVRPVRLPAVLPDHLIVHQIVVLDVAVRLLD